MTPNFALTIQFTKSASVAPGGFWTSTYPINAVIGGAGAVLVDGAAIAIDASIEGVQSLTAASNAARVFQVPTGGIVGQIVPVRLINTSGGALNATTFVAAIKQPAALTFPATGFNRTYYLRPVLLAAVLTWSLIGDSGADCAN